MRAGLLAGVVVALVLGILGMHGFDAHGVTMHGPVTPAAGAAAAMTMGMAHDDHVTAASGAAHSGSDAAPSPASHPDDQASGMGDLGGMGAMALMCVAMLAGAAVALLVLLTRRGRLPKVWAVLDAAGRRRAAVPAVLRVGTGPPAVWRFSIIRC